MSISAEWSRLVESIEDSVEVAFFPEDRVARGADMIATAFRVPTLGLAVVSSSSLSELFGTKVRDLKDLVRLVIGVTDLAAGEPVEGAARRVSGRRVGSGAACVLCCEAAAAAAESGRHPHLPDWADTLGLPRAMVGAQQKTDTDSCVSERSQANGGDNETGRKKERQRSGLSYNLAAVSSFYDLPQGNLNGTVSDREPTAPR